MARTLLVTAALICALVWPVFAEARPHRSACAAPVFIEGAGTVWICAPPPRRR